MPEHTNKLLLSSLSSMEEPYRFFNLDVFEYELDSAMALYGAIPMVRSICSTVSYLQFSLIV